MSAVQQMAGRCDGWCDEARQQQAAGDKAAAQMKHNAQKPTRCAMDTTAHTAAGAVRATGMQTCQPLSRTVCCRQHGVCEDEDMRAGASGRCNSVLSMVQQSRKAYAASAPHLEPISTCCTLELTDRVLLLGRPAVRLLCCAVLCRAGCFTGRLWPKEAREAHIWGSCSQWLAACLVLKPAAKVKECSRRGIVGC
jgi:hypothetical protein